MTKPRILAIDDQLQSVETLELVLGQDTNFLALTPNDVTEQDLWDAHLVLVDFLIDDWPEREQQSAVALKPITGLALSAVLREHAHQAQVGQATPTAFALNSGQLQKLTPYISTERRPYVLSSLYGLEWIFAKGDSRNPAQMRALANTVLRLPAIWPFDLAESDRLTRGLLELGADYPWTNTAWEAVLEARPPIHELVQGSHSLMFVRWLAHRVLPYPCFLLSVSELARRLFVTTRSMEAELSNPDSAINITLEPARYCGILSSFLGLRWWRAGVDSILWEQTKGRSFDPTAIKDLLDSSGRLESLEIADPVTVLDEDLSPVRIPIDVRDAVRIQPDDWPDYADQAWVSVELAQDSDKVAGLVVSADKDRIAPITDSTPDE